MFLTIKTHIFFPNLGLRFPAFGNGFKLFGIDIMYYGIIVVCGMLFGVLMAQLRAKNMAYDSERIIDFSVYAIVAAVIGARLYYVVFSWDSFKENPIQIFNLRTGGLAIYGGIIGGVLAGLLYCRIRRITFYKLADVCMPALLLGQIVGRWGNFFNREAFGKYTNSLFAMQLDLRVVNNDYQCSTAYLNRKYEGRQRVIDNIMEIRNNTVFVDGIEYIQVHPTFLYESVWNLFVMAFLIYYTPHRKFDGEIMLLYLIGYGLGRVWIEGLRTDQLLIWNTSIAVSQLLSGLVVAVSFAAYVVMRRKNIKLNRIK